MTPGKEQDSAALCAMLREARERTIGLVTSLDAGQLIGPKLGIVNPPLWELGHVGWFQEYWCLRRRTGDIPRPSILSNADNLYDSAAVAHSTRWGLPLPDLERTLSYLRQVLERVLEKVCDSTAGDNTAYFAQLAAYHEEMHCEALTYTRQTLGYPAPASRSGAVPREAGGLRGDAEIAGGPFMLGAQPGDGFVFDNEKWAHEVRIAPFRISRAAVTNAEFAAFVEDGGYCCRQFWSDPGWRWRSQSGAEHPVYWRRREARWQQRRYDRLQDLQPSAPVLHVNWYEAEAYCSWAGRRLPTEAEWEYAASTTPESGNTKRRYPWGDEMRNCANFHGVASDDCVDVTTFAAGDSGWGCRQMLGNVWEWTADWFMPYPGFVRDPYKEYSEPWFGSHKVLRGGSFATRSILMRNTWRNFYTPDRNDVFAGFRTCAL